MIGLNIGGGASVSPQRENEMMIGFGRPPTGINRQSTYNIGGGYADSSNRYREKDTSFDNSIGGDSNLKPLFKMDILKPMTGNNIGSGLNTQTPKSNQGGFS